MAIGFKHGSSGGDVLGITVVPGTTRPSSPKENTIWANSSNTMGSFSISPNEPHRVSRSRNQIVYPYLSDSRDAYGLIFTVNTSTSSSARGTVTVNGTNTSSGAIVFRLSNEGIENRELILQPGNYVVCGNCTSSSSTTHRLLLAYSYDNWGSSTQVNDNNGDGTAFTLDKVAKARISIQVLGKQTATNAVYKPMLVREGESTGYVVGNATGQVWVKTAPGSKVLMDAIKGKNSIYFQPSEVYEYTTNNGWVKREAQIYQYGAWKPLEDLTGYYFKDGNQCTDVTGGWSSEGWVTTGSATVGDTLIASGLGGSLVAVGTVNAVDLTNASKVWIDSPKGANGYNYGYMFISKNKSVTDSVANAQINKAGSFSIDVSSLSGKYYIYLYAAAGAYVDARAIWME